MGIADFFKFRSKFVSSTFTAYPEIGLKQTLDPIPDPAGAMDIWNIIHGEYDNIALPVVCNQVDGKKLIDILNTGCCSLYLISDRFKKILEANHLTGWKTFPIKLYDKKRNEIFGYQGFSITGRCGPIDLSKSEIIGKRMVPTGPVFKVYKGCHIGLAQWDGTDFFIPEKTRAIIVTKRTADVLKKNKVTNMELENLADWEKS